MVRSNPLSGTNRPTDKTVRLSFAVGSKAAGGSVATAGIQMLFCGDRCNFSIDCVFTQKTFNAFSDRCVQTDRFSKRNISSSTTGGLSTKRHCHTPGECIGWESMDDYLQAPRKKVCSGSTKTGRPVAVEVDAVCQIERQLFAFEPEGEAALPDVKIQGRQQGPFFPNDHPLWEIEI